MFLKSWKVKTEKYKKVVFFWVSTVFYIWVLNFFSIGFLAFLFWTRKVQFLCSNGESGFRFKAIRFEAEWFEESV